MAFGLSLYDYNTYIIILGSVLIYEINMYIGSIMSSKIAFRFLLFLVIKFVSSLLKFILLMIRVLRIGIRNTLYYKDNNIRITVTTLCRL